MLYLLSFHANMKTMAPIITLNSRIITNRTRKKRSIHHIKNISQSYPINHKTKDQVLSLYRDILRTIKKMHWCDEKGVPWNVRLKEETQKEFQIAKYETDTLLIMRMIIIGRECLSKIQMKIDNADAEIKSRIERERSRK